MSFNSVHLILSKLEYVQFWKKNENEKQNVKLETRANVVLMKFYFNLNLTLGQIRLKPRSNSSFSNSVCPYKNNHNTHVLKIVTKIFVNNDS